MPMMVMITHANENPLLICFAIVSMACVDDLYAKKKKSANIRNKINVRFYCDHLGAVDVKNALNSEGVFARGLPGLE